MEDRRVRSSRNINIKLRKIVYYFLGVIESLLAFRLIFRVLGANPEGAFVSLIYSITEFLQAPFGGIFRSAVTAGIETRSVMEPTTIISMVVYAIVAYGIVKLIKILETPRIQTRV